MRNIDPEPFSHGFHRIFRQNVRLSDFAYSLCGGPCAGMIEAVDSEKLYWLVRICQILDIPYRVLGGLSNVLVSEDGFDGVVLLNREGQLRHNEAADGDIVLTVDSGVSMAYVDHFCGRCSGNYGLTGFEWASGLPGTVGGAVYGNAGAFGSCIADHFIRAVYVDDRGDIQEINKEEMGFSYRSSVFKRGKKGVLLSAQFLVQKGDRETIGLKQAANRDKRRNTQPVDKRSLGSVFKNPEGYSAGKLIQDAGLKGYSIGKVTVSTKHANFFTTVNGASSMDYRQLILYVQKVVFDCFGVRLEPEIEFIGFGD